MSRVGLVAVVLGPLVVASSLVEAQGLAPYTLKPRVRVESLTLPSPPPLEDPVLKARLESANARLSQARTVAAEARQRLTQAHTDVAQAASALAVGSQQLSEAATKRPVSKPLFDSLSKQVADDRMRIDAAKAAEGRLRVLADAADAAVAEAESEAQALEKKKREAEEAAQAVQREKEISLTSAALETALFDQCNRLFMYAPPKDGTAMAAAIRGIEGKASASDADTIQTLEAKLADLDKNRTPSNLCTGDDACNFYWLIKTCTVRLDTANKESVAKDGKTVVHADLISQYLSYIRLRHWAETANLRNLQVLGEGTTRGQVSARTVFDQLETQIPDRLKKHNLTQLFSAVLVSGPMFGDTGEVAKTINDKSADFGALSTILWQSAHFGNEDEWGKWDYSLGGRVGLQPVLTIVKAEDTETTGGETPATKGRRLAEAGEEEAAAEPEPEHQQALGWTMGIAANRRVSNYAEVSLGAKVGGSYLVSSPLLVDRGVRDSYVAVNVQNGTGRTAWLWEVGAEVNMFNAPLGVLHIAKDLLSPQLSAGIAVRRDSRFKKDGDLLGFDDPEWRLVYRFMLDAVTVIDRRQVGEDAKPFTFGFGVEYERSLKGSASVPSATRFILRGNVNLFKGLKGGDPAEEKAEEPAEAGKKDET